MIKQELNKLLKSHRCEGTKSLDSKVWSVTIKGQNDCVVLTDFEAMQVKMKFMPDIEMYDMTERHGMKPEHLHQENRRAQLEDERRDIFFQKWEGIGGFGGYAKVDWTFEDLLKMEAK